MAFTVVVPQATPDLGTVDPVVVSGGTDPGTWLFNEGAYTIVDGADLSARAEQTRVYIARETNIVFQDIFKLGIADAGEFRVDAIAGLLRIMAADSGNSTIGSFILNGGMKVIDAGGGTWTNVECSAGELSIASGTVVTNWYQKGGVHSIGYNSTGLTSLSVEGGSLTCRRGLADDCRAFIGGRSRVLFRRAQSTTSPGITISGSDGELHINDAATVDWHGGAIDRVYLHSDYARFNWQDMPAAATIGTVVGSATAIERSGIRQGAVNTLRNGGTLTVNTVSSKAGKPGQMLSPSTFQLK